jgi:hypothetical protein
MKQFLIAMRRHGLPMIAAASSASVLTWMMCDLEYSKRKKTPPLPLPAPEKKPETEHEWHGN